MRTLKVATGTFDRINSFNVKTPNGVVRGVHLYKDYNKEGDGLYWGLNAGSMLSASYSPAENMERERLNHEPPLTNGEVVAIDGKRFRTKVLGDYSDCALFEPF